MYSFRSRIRYSETDPDAKLSYLGLMNYLQDCSTFQSEDAGVGVRYLKSVNKAWLLTSWNIEIERRPEIGEEIIISTWPYDFRGIYGYRNFSIKDGEGDMLVKADSLWFLYDTAHDMPIRVADEDASPYGPCEPRLDMEKMSRKIPLPEDMHEAARLSVLRHQIDTNLHVNNAQYIDMVREALPESAAGKEITGIRAEYRKAAVLGDEILIMLGVSENKYTASLQDPYGTVYANVELKI